MNFFLLSILTLSFSASVQAVDFACDSDVSSSQVVEQCLSDYATRLLTEKNKGFRKTLAQEIKRQRQWQKKSSFTWPIKMSNAKPLSAFYIGFEARAECSIFNANRVSVKREKSKKKRVFEVKQQLEDIVAFLSNYHLLNNGLKTSRIFQIQKVLVCADAYKPSANEKARSIGFTQNTVFLQMPVERNWLDYGYKSVSASKLMQMWNAGLHFKPNRILKKKELLNYSMYRLWPLLNPTGKIRLFVRKFLVEQNIDLINRISCPKGSCSSFLGEARNVLDSRLMKKLQSLSNKKQSELVGKIYKQMFDDMDIRIEQMGLAAIDGPGLSLNIVRKTRFSIVNVQNAHVINVSAFLGALGKTDKDFVKALKKFAPKQTNHQINIRSSNGISLVNIDTFDYVNVNVNLFGGLAPANFLISLKKAL